MKAKSKFILGFILAVSFGVMSSNELMAQNSTARAGIKGGVNFSNLYIDDVDDENARIGFNVGLYGQILSSEVFALQPELLYTTKGSQADYNGIFGQQTVKFNLNYLEVPLLAVFKLGSAAEIHAGAYASYLVNANIKTEGDVSNDIEQLDRDNFNKGDYGLVGGFGLNFGAAQIGARYNYGLQKIANSDAARNALGDSKNSSATLYIAFNFNQ